MRTSLLLLPATAPGMLDLTFDTDGKVTTAIRSNVDEANGVAVQFDGKIVTVGYSFDSVFEGDFALSRHNPNGSLDTNFGGGGKVTTEFDSDGDIANAVAVQTNGKIVVAGQSLIRNNNAFALARYNPNGSLDTDFDSSNDIANAMAIQIDGKLALAGTSANLFALARYHGDPTNADIYVRNVGQTPGGSLRTSEWTQAQGFTTGTDASGYTLGSVDTVIENTDITSAQRDTIRAELWSTATGGSNAGQPDSKLYDLTVPAHPIAAGTVKFAAPAGTTLTASTTYYAVFYTVGDFDMHLDQTGLINEDSGGGADWSISDGRRFVWDDEPTSMSSWSDAQPQTLRISVNGPDSTTSSNANLTNLTASSSDSATGTFNPVTLSPATFSAATTSYTATVANDQSHAKVTPMVEDTGKATVWVRRGSTGVFTSVNDSTASGAISLDVGDDAITVRVTA